MHTNRSYDNDVADQIIQERTAFAQIREFLNGMDWTQKIAVAQIACNQISAAGDVRLVKLEPFEKTSDYQLREVAGLMRLLPPETLAEIAIQILEEPRDSQRINRLPPNSLPITKDGRAMTMATTERPVRAADMGRTEAEEVTQAIKDNFDSLGAMLIQARDRKAYKALGYRSFESYCQTEFGRSISSAYQLIEDAKILSQLEARISENYGEEITLKVPASHLKPLKAIESIDDKLKAIEYAKKLAESEGKKATKQHLEIAIFEISGKRSKDFKSAIQKLGFTQGTPVEIQSPIKKERGVVRKIDKLGKIHVELYYGENKAKEYDATQLRILTNEEKPTNPLESTIASKGDRVLIYAQGLEGKKGTIYTWKEGKQTLVIVDGQNSPNSIAYAEMELLKSERKDTNWEADLSWDTAKQTYYYFQKEDKIYSRQWPAGLTLTPHSHELNPIEFMANWEEKSAGSLLETLATPANLKTLVLAKAIELPETQAKEFASDLIASLRQLFWDEIPESPSILLAENERLREQLSKVEADRDNLLVRITEAQNRYLKLKKEEVDPLEDRLNQLDNQLIESEKELRSVKKDLELTIKQSQQGLFQEEISRIALSNSVLQARLVEAEAVIEAMISKAHSSTLDVEDEPHKELPPEISNRIVSERQKLLDRIEKYQQTKAQASKKEIPNIEKQIKVVHNRLTDLQRLEGFRIGQTVCHQNRPMILGKITGFDFSTGEMPIIWLRYFEDGELQTTTDQELVGMIFRVDI